MAVQSFPKDKNQSLEHLNTPYARVIVPNIVGLLNTTAQAELDSNGLRPSEEYFSAETGAPGIVIDQDIAPGKRARFRRKIKYTVRTLSAVTTPYVVGQTKNNAILTIAANLLT